MNQQVQDTDHQLTAGEVLRAARLEKAFSCKDVARHLKIPGHIVEAIESDNLSKTPQVYRRGYLRLYADLVGVEYAQLPALCESTTDDEGNGFVRSLPSGQSKQWFEHTLKVASYAIVTAGVVMPLVWVFTQGALQLSFDDSLQQTQPITSSANEEPTTTLVTGQTSSAPTLSASAAPFSSLTRSVNDLSTTEDPIIAEENSVNVDGAAEQTLQDLGNTPSDDALLNDTPTLGAVANLDSGDETLEADLDTLADVLVLEFLDGSWVEITDADGEKLEFDLLAAGQKKTYSGLAPFNIILGQASAVDLTLNGERVDLSPHTRSDVATVVLETNRPNQETNDR